jgi:hypothetical protein
MDPNALRIEKIDSLAIEKFSKNGVQKELHILAKNIAFTMTVLSPINLNSSPLSASLYYDFEDDEDPRAVDTLKSVPLESTSHVDSSGYRAVVELRVYVLSSQHENSFFRVRFSAVDPKTKKTLEVYSHPLKIISKRNQVRKMLARNEVMVENPSALPPKRTSSDQIAETLQRLEEQQQKQFKLLEALAHRALASPTSGFVYQPPSPIPDPEDMEFSSAFKKFLKAYKQIPASERASKVRKAMKKSATEDMELLGDFMNTYSSEVLQSVESNFIPSLMLPMCDCDCADGNCSHKKDLEKMELFYNDVLFASSPQSASKTQCA